MVVEEGHGVVVVVPEGFRTVVVREEHGNMKRRARLVLVRGVRINHFEERDTY